MQRWIPRGNARIAVAAAALVAMTILNLLAARNLAIWAEAGVLYAPTPNPLVIGRDLAVGWAFGIAGLVAMRRWPESRAGLLMVLIGITSQASPLVYLPVPALVTIGQWVSGAPLILLGILVLGYPSGRIRSEPDRLWVTFAMIHLVAIQLALALVTPLGIWECADCHSLVTLSYDERARTNLFWLSSWSLLLLAAALLVLLVRRWIRATPPARRLLTPVWLAGLTFTAIAFTVIFLEGTGAGGDDLSALPNPGRFIRIQAPTALWEAIPWIVAASLMLVPMAFVWGLMRLRMGQAAVSALAVELRRTRDRPPLVESLRRAVGDRSLELGLWSRPAAGYVTPEGMPMRLADPAAGRAVTVLDGEDGPLAVMVHDPALGDQRELIDGVGAVAQLALENERLHAEVKAQLEEVRASRERIVSAADAERRRVERNIHDGAQQRLVSLSLALSMAQAKAATASPDIAATLAAAEAELRQAIVELRELARGIHPAILTEAGLGPALESLADHSAVPVSVEADLDGRRLSPLVEATAYFVAAEALTNVARHAAASAVSLRASIADGWLRLSVADDGTGGADPARGTGLRGLFDRVAALGGRLRIEDADGRGTRLEAEIPCE